MTGPAYALRGMNGERALARIKRGLEATPETRNHWFDAEIAERMAAGDVPRGVAEKEIVELHTHAAKTYRASERARVSGLLCNVDLIHASGKARPRRSPVGAKNSPALVTGPATELSVPIVMHELTS